MQKLMATNDPVLLSFVEALLQEAGIGYMIADQHISITEGSIGLFPRRVLVQNEDLAAARRVLKLAQIEAACE